MNRILLIDPGKGWGNFVSKLYCYKKLSEYLNSKLIILTKRSTQAKSYLKKANFCENIIYLEEPKRGINNFIYNIKCNFRNIKIINDLKCDICFVFHPSIRYLFFARISNIKNIWALGYRFQNFFISKKNSFYSSFISKAIKNDNEALEFVKKITKSNDISFEPLEKVNKKSQDTIGIIIAASGYEKRWAIENYLKIIKFLQKKGFKKFLVVSGIDQSSEEDLIKRNFDKKINIIFSSKKKIYELIPLIKKCKFCIGNDTGFSHLSISFGIDTFVLYGDCPPQNYSNLIHHIDIEQDEIRSDSSIKLISPEKVISKLNLFIK